MSQMKDEFAPGTAEWPEGLSRRDFLRLSGATLALAGVTACVRAPTEKIFPYVHQPEDVIPGKPLHYATIQVIDGLAHGIIVESHEGRPTRIDGNPKHPAMASGGASAIHQAYVLELYNPARAKQVLFKGKPSDWKHMYAKLDEIRQGDGSGTWILTEMSSSPTLHEQMRRIQKKYPKARWVQYSPMVPAPTKEVPIYDLKKADVVVCLDADLFASPEFPLTYTNDYVTCRRKMESQSKINSLIVAETSASLTGHSATLRAQMSPRELEEFANEMHACLSGSLTAKTPFLKKILPHLTAANGRIAFFAGDSLQEVCRDLNRKSECVHFITNPRFSANAGPAALAELAKAANAGQIQNLFVIGGDPVARAPAALGLQAAFAKAARSFRLSLFHDTTSKSCSWQLPMSHGLESWTDARAFDGSVSLAQPLITPLYKTRTWHELAQYLETGETKTSHDILQSHWERQIKSDFDARWKEILTAGVVPNTSFKKLKPEPPTPRKQLPSSAVNTDEVDIIFRPDPKIYDGSFAQNAWLRELPDPVTKLTWENVAWISPHLAARFKLENGQHIRVKTETAELEAPVWIQPGQPQESVTLLLGYGETFLADDKQPSGYNAAALWPADHSRSVRGHIEPLRQKTRLACTQTHSSTEDREILKTVTPRDLNKPPKAEAEPATLYNPKSDEANAWGMIIDLDSCTGCGACVIACQAENNIPTVGKEQVGLGREMHWIRVDRYYSGSPDEPKSYFQPVPCMHCEKAPCEYVCPVGATVHGSGGLNEMIYNRCVGTRYCSNNCPYKVRRFNFLTYSKSDDLSKMQKNPDVSVRPRGVMEKCTYCIQRINAARIQADSEQRKIKTDEVQTACQRTCPASAIVFGDLNDKNSEIAHRRNNSRRFSMLENLGTKPRTTYLAKIEEDGG